MNETTEQSEKLIDEGQSESNLSSNEVKNLSFLDIVPPGPVLEKIKALGYQTPTDVQMQAIPPALEREDVIMQARTGSGKTLAFVVPLLHHLLTVMEKKEIKTPFGLVVAPTRELAQQVRDVVQSLAPELSPTLLIGGVDLGAQINELKSEFRIVVGTPGRLLDLLRQKVLRLNQCRYFVLDEADEMLSMGFLEDVRAILSHLPDRRQGLFVSATITPRVEMLAHSFLTKPKRVVIGDYTSDVPDIKHCFCEVGGDLMAKPAALCDLIEVCRPRSAIIFCNTKSDTQLVEALLRRRGFDARRINSDLTQTQRERIMRKIRNDELQLLVATDIAARGLDIEQIELVINYNIHDQPEVYIHRTGRTGRAGRSGKAISLVGPRDVGAFHFLGKVVEVEFEKIPLPTDVEVAEARLVHLYEIIHQNEIDLTERELIAAQKLVKELGGIEDPTEELVLMVGKLSKYAVEHLLSQEAKSLEEELPPVPEEEQEERVEGDYGRERDHRSRDRGEHRDRHGRDRDRGRGRDRGGRDRDRGGRDRDHGGRERERGGRDRGEHRERHGRDHDRGRGRDRDRGEHRSRGYERRDHDRQDYSGGQRQRESSGEQHGHERQAPDEVRLYIGQGMAHGMTAPLFKELAAEFADLQPKDLHKLTIRENYGFVDLYRAEAEILIGSLNGIEYNGQQLPIEYATTISQRSGRNAGPGRREPRHNEE